MRSRLPNKQTWLSNVPLNAIFVAKRGIFLNIVLKPHVNKPIKPQPVVNAVDVVEVGEEDDNQHDKHSRLISLRYKLNRLPLYTVAVPECWS
jgi:hypothetical protein